MLAAASPHIAAGSPHLAAGSLPHRVHAGGAFLEVRIVLATMAVRLKELNSQDSKNTFTSRI